MNILFISKGGEELGIAMRCADEGYSVILFVEDDNYSLVGDGIVNKSKFPKHITNLNGSCIASSTNQLIELEKPNLVISTSPGMGRVVDYLREQGIETFGGGHWADTLSNGGGYSVKILNRIGVNVWDGESGIKVSCGAWWNGFRLSSPYISFNENYFLTGSIGSLIPSAGNISHHISPESKIFKNTIGKMERLLKKTKFKGNISISCTVSRNNIYGTLFITSSLFLPSLLEAYKGSVTELLSAIVAGREPKGKFTTDYTLSIPITIPPYPFHVPSTNASTEIEGVCLSNLKHLYLKDVRKDGDNYGSVGNELMVVSARGRDINEARKRAYKTIPNLSIQSIQYRVDIGERAIKDEKTLGGWGYLD